MFVSEAQKLTQVQDYQPIRQEEWSEIEDEMMM